MLRHGLLERAEDEAPRSVARLKEKPLTEIKATLRAQSLSPAEIRTVMDAARAFQDHFHLQAAALGTTGVWRGEPGSSSIPPQPSPTDFNLGEFDDLLAQLQTLVTDSSNIEQLISPFSFGWLILTQLEKIKRFLVDEGEWEGFLWALSVESGVQQILHASYESLKSLAETEGIDVEELFRQIGLEEYLKKVEVAIAITPAVFVTTVTSLGEALQLPRVTTDEMLTIPTPRLAFARLGAIIEPITRDKFHYAPADDLRSRIVPVRMMDHLMFARERLYKGERGEAMKHAKALVDLLLQTEVLYARAGSNGPFLAVTATIRVLEAMEPDEEGFPPIEELRGRQTRYGEEIEAIAELYDASDLDIILSLLETVGKDFYEEGVRLEQEGWREAARDFFRMSIFWLGQADHWLEQAYNQTEAEGNQEAMESSTHRGLSLLKPLLPSLQASLGPNPSLAEIIDVINLHAGYDILAESGIAASSLGTVDDLMTAAVIKDSLFSLLMHVGIAIPPITDYLIRKGREGSVDDLQKLCGFVSTHFFFAAQGLGLVPSPISRLFHEVLKVLADLHEEEKLHLLMTHEEFVALLASFIKTLGLQEVPRDKKVQALATLEKMGRASFLNPEQRRFFKEAYCPIRQAFLGLEGGSDKFVAIDETSFLHRSSMTLELTKRDKANMENLMMSTNDPQQMSVALLIYDENGRILILRHKKGYDSLHVPLVTGIFSEADIHDRIPRLFLEQNGLPVEITERIGVVTADLGEDLPPWKAYIFAAQLKLDSALNPIPGQRILWKRPWEDDFRYSRYGRLRLLEDSLRRMGRFYLARKGYFRLFGYDRWRTDQREEAFHSARSFAAQVFQGRVDQVLREGGEEYRHYEGNVGGERWSLFVEPDGLSRTIVFAQRGLLGPWPSEGQVSDEEFLASINPFLQKVNRQLEIQGSDSIHPESVSFYKGRYYLKGVVVEVDGEFGWDFYRGRQGKEGTAYVGYFPTGIKVTPHAILNRHIADGQPSLDVSVEVSPQPVGLQEAEVAAEVLSPPTYPTEGGSVATVSQSLGEPWEDRLERTLGDPNFNPALRIDHDPANLAAARAGIFAATFASVLAGEKDVRSNNLQQLAERGRHLVEAALWQHQHPPQTLSDAEKASGHSRFEEIKGQFTSLRKKFLELEHGFFMGSDFVSELSRAALRLEELIEKCRSSQVSLLEKTEGELGILVGHIKIAASKAFDLRAYYFKDQDDYDLMGAMNANVRWFPLESVGSGLKKVQEILNRESVAPYIWAFLGEGVSIPKLVDSLEEVYQAVPGGRRLDPSWVDTARLCLKLALLLPEESENLFFYTGFLINSVLKKPLSVADLFKETTAQNPTEGGSVATVSQSVGESWEDRLERTLGDPNFNPALHINHDPANLTATRAGIFAATSEPVSAGSGAQENSELDLVVRKTRGVFGEVKRALRGGEQTEGKKALMREIYRINNFFRFLAEDQEVSLFVVGTVIGVLVDALRVHGIPLPQRGGLLQQAGRFKDLDYDRVISSPPLPAMEMYEAFTQSNDLLRKGKREATYLGDDQSALVFARGIRILLTWSEKGEISKNNAGQLFRVLTYLWESRYYPAGGEPRMAIAVKWVLSELEKVIAGSSGISPPVVVAQNPTEGGPTAKVTVLDEEDDRGDEESSGRSFLVNGGLAYGGMPASGIVAVRVLSRSPLMLIRG